MRVLMAVGEIVSSRPVVYGVGAVCASLGLAGAVWTSAHTPEIYDFGRAVDPATPRFWSKGYFLFVFVIFQVCILVAAMLHPPLPGASRADRIKWGLQNLAFMVFFAAVAYRQIGAGFCAFNACSGLPFVASPG